MTSATTTELSDVELNLNPPDRFLCPITCEVMTDPVVSIHGHHFQREAIISWLSQGNDTCPLTRKPLTMNKLIADRGLQAQIQNWWRIQGMEPPPRDDVARGEGIDDEQKIAKRLGCVVEPTSKQIAEMLQRHRRARRRWSLLPGRSANH